MNRPQINLMATGNRIRERRKALGFSVTETASRMGVVPMAWYKYEQGKCLPKDYENLVYLAELLDTRIDELVVLDRAV